jgi:hypothetical protein
LEKFGVFVRVVVDGHFSAPMHGILKTRSSPVWTSFPAIGAT